MLARSEPSGIRVNVGCGGNPSPGWLNLDNSPSVRLARWPVLWPLLGREQRGFAMGARRLGVRYGVATRLPLADGSADAVYSSHMLEHLDRSEARRFLGEALRVLRPGGVLRIAVPDLRRHILAYQEDGDADRFMADTLLGAKRPDSFRAWVHNALVGPRHHLWMYDEASLGRLLEAAGFAAPMALPAGQTTIPAPGALNLSERAHESIYVEAVRP